MQILVWIAALAIGLSLGIIGGGGSILTVPVLTYMMDVEPSLATGYSLFVVGVSALFGAITKYKQGLVDVKTGVIFAIPSFIAVYITRAYLMPLIPQEIFSVGYFTLTKDIFIMVFFAIIMLAASYSMIKGRKEVAMDENQSPQYNYPVILLEGFIVGIVTGIVGAGGGFLIIPALVLLAKIPMKKAVGTSLMIITAKSLFGFVGEVQTNGDKIDWELLLTFSGIAVVGILLGTYLSKFISAKNLKKGFGYFVLLMAFYILAKSLL
jgi:uncharacterized membrane protein YfcA